MQLLSNGADVHYVNCSKDAQGSALHEAVYRGHEDMVNLLLQCAGGDRDSPCLSMYVA